MCILWLLFWKVQSDVVDCVMYTLYCIVCESVNVYFLFRQWNLNVMAHEAQLLNVLSSVSSTFLIMYDGVVKISFWNQWCCVLHLATLETDEGNVRQTLNAQVNTLYYFWTTGLTFDLQPFSKLSGSIWLSANLQICKSDTD